MVWSSRLDGGLSQRRSMLGLDVFICHKTNDTKVLLRRTNTDLVIIPGGMTSLLQPLDVSINKPFKAMSLLIRLWRRPTRKAGG